ncbi:RsmB/NOP family class I SAM-dependent RNA methyltransferase [Candidatus Woesearchaeota archaeon]|nr:RsmB/NOP family class I SAM-dependent RNA methyltransferase [Candidatus Woesearchaeota archaeon]
MSTNTKNTLLDRYKKLLHKIEYKEVPTVIRVNTLATTHEKVIERLKKELVELTKIPFLRNGYTTTSKRSMASMTPYMLGYYYIQETASQIPVEILNPQPGEKIIDMCAAPGGKTTQISQMMKNEGAVHAYESKKHRIDSLMNNIERMRVTNAIIFNKDVLEAKGEYDKVLLDAPCSGNLASDKEWLSKRTIEGIKENAKIQEKLLHKAINLCKEGGIVVYSTCSLEPEENEEVITNVLKLRKDTTLEDTDCSIGSSGLKIFDSKKYCENIELTKRFWPDECPTQGFFIAKIRKTKSKRKEK